MSGDFIRSMTYLIAFHLFFVPCALAAPGDLDPAFNAAGVNIYSGQARAKDSGRGIAVQPDGKIVVVGYVHNGTNRDILVTRYNSDGTLDTDFGNAGAATYDGGNDDFGYAVGIQADGKIIVGGHSYNGANDDLIILCFASDGGLYNAFGSGGATVYSGWQSSEYCKALAIQPDGKIVVVGRYQDLMGNEDALVLRYNADGSSDVDFGFSGGTSYDSFGNDSATAVAVQPDGKIAVAGFSDAGGTNDVLLIRYGSDGQIDSTFGGTGVVRYGGAQFDDHATGVVIDAGGNIIVSGYSDNGTNNDLLVLKYDGQGSLDGSFGTGGAKTFDSGRADYAHSVTVQGDGKIIVAGTTDNGTSDDLLIMRYDADGSIDASFGSAGIIAYDSGHADHGYAVSLQGDGKIVTAGSVENGTFYDMITIRCTAGGNLDDAFDTDGVVVNDTAFPTLEYAYAVTVQPDGKILVAGETIGDVLLLRYSAEGVLDATFGTGGVVSYDGAGSDAAYAVAVQGDGKIVVSGSTMGSSNHDLLLLRYHPDGTLDADFGTGGAVTYDAGGDDTSFAVAVQADGKIVTAGGGGNMFGSQSLLVRFNTDGTPDAGFGTAGMATYDAGGFDNTAYSVSVLPNGKIVVGGYSLSRLLLLQYLSDGTPDASFGTEGVVRPDNGRAEYGTNAAVGPDGKAIVTGYAYNAETDSYDLVVARFNSSGVPDPAFGTGGVVSYGGGKDHYPLAATIQLDGKILLAGNTPSPSDGTDELFVLRLEPSGSVDSTFGTNGKFIYTGGSYDYGMAMAIQPDGKIVVSGNTVEEGDDIVTLRLQGGVFPLLVTSSSGGTIASDDGSISCGSDCSESYAAIRQITLTATAAAGYSFTSWSGCEATSGNQCTVTTSMSRTVSATFADTVPPTLSISTPPVDLITDLTSFTIRGTVTDVGAVSIAVTVNGQTFTPVVVIGAFEQTITFTSETSHLVAIIATDDAGNETTVQRSITYTKIGDLDGTSGVSVADALMALRFSIRLASPDPLEFSRCDLAPLVNGIPQPDGVIDIADVLLILRRAVGLDW